MTAFRPGLQFYLYIIPVMAYIVVLSLFAKEYKCSRRIGIVGIAAMWLFPPTIWCRICAFIVGKSGWYGVMVSYPIGVLSALFVCIVMAGWLGAAKYDPELGLSTAGFVWFVVPLVTSLVKCKTET
jgi:hypothetical protein